MEKQIKKLLKDEFGFVESDYNKTCQTVITFLSDIIKEKMEDIRMLNEKNYFLDVERKNFKIMVEDLQQEKKELKNNSKYEND
jgi:flagellar biosynthesis component FlhA